MEEQRKALIKEIKDSLTAIFKDELSLLNISVEDLIRADELGKELNFSDAKGPINQIIAILKDVNEHDFEQMPIPIALLKGIRDRYKQTFDIFAKILNFRPTGQNPVEARNDIITKLENHYSSFYSLFAQLLPDHYLRKDIKFESIKKEAETTLSKLLKMEKDYKEYYEQKAKESDTIIEKMRKASAEVGVSQHAMHFNQEAKEYKKRGYFWLMLSAGFGISILLFAGYNIVKYMNMPTEYFQRLNSVQALQIGIPKLIIFSILYFAVIWSAKTYKAQWHNYVVNKHRQNALSTFETFVKASDDPQTKNAVLFQTTQCIFSQQNSGFITQDKESAPSPAVLEIIRNIMQEQK